MPGRKVLYVSGSFGLGHVYRDLAIVEALRERYSDLDFYWLAGDPASGVLKQAGETLVPEAAVYGNDTASAEKAARGQRLELLSYLLGARGEWQRNVAAYKRAVEREQFALVIADEAYEIALWLLERPNVKRAPFVMIFDFVGLDTMSRSPLEWLGIYYFNRLWQNDGKMFGRSDALSLFIGELEDIPDRRFGPFLPNRREHARTFYHPVGYILAFDPAKCLDRPQLRAELGYGREPLIVCSIGGTAIGRELLELCGQAFPIVQQSLPDVRMVLVCGPRLDPGLVKVPAGPEVRGYVPQLYKHFAASDLAVVQGGGSTTLELTALRRPFLYFPREGDAEQGLMVGGRLARHGAGVRMQISSSSPALLAEAMLANIGKEVTYPPIPLDGARVAAQLIGRYL